MSSNKPFPSSDLDVFKENSLILDNFVNSQENEYPDRFNRKRPTITGIIKEAFNVRTDISNMNETLIGQSRWDVVPKNTSLSLGGDNGALNKQAQALFNRTVMLKVHTREALRRTYLQIGLNLVEGSFEEGGTLESITDILLEEKTGKVYSWAGSFPKVISKGTMPSSEIEFTQEHRVSENTSIFLTDFLPSNFKRDGSQDYTVFVQKAIDKSAELNKPLVWPSFPIGVFPPVQTVPPEQHPYVLLTKDNSNWIGTPIIKLINTNLPGYSIIKIASSNVYIYRPKIIGDTNVNNSSGEWGYGINITSGATNVEIFEPNISHCHGDGIYIGMKWKESGVNVHPKNIFIFKPITISCRRNGISFTSGDNVSIVHHYAENVNTLAPGAAIDIEPENAVGFTRPSISNSRIIGGSCKNCLTGIAFNLFEHVKVDLTVEGCYDAGNATIPYSFISSPAINDIQQSRILIDTLKSDKGLINISTQGAHLFKINRLCVRDETPNFSITNQSNPLDPLVITGFIIKDIVYDEKLPQQLGILTDGLTPVNKPIFMGTFRLGSEGRYLKYIYHSNQISDYIFSEGCLFDFVSTVTGYEFFSMTVSNRVSVEGEAGYSTVNIYIDGDRRDIQIKASPKFGFDQGHSIIITSKNSANFFFKDDLNVFSSQKLVTLKPYQVANVSWIPGTVKDYLVRIN